MLFAIYIMPVALQMPDGTRNIPIEQVIAIVAKDKEELARLGLEVPITSRAAPRSPIIASQSMYSPTPNNLNRPAYPRPHSPTSAAPFLSQRPFSHYHQDGILTSGARGMGTTHATYPSPSSHTHGYQSADVTDRNQVYI